MNNGLISAVGDEVAAFLFPQGCHVCGNVVGSRALGVACSECWGDARVTRVFASEAVCSRCGAPGLGACTDCLPASIRIARSVGLHAGAIRASLIDLKRRPRLCGRLTGLVADAFNRARALRGMEIIVPVPLHPDRHAERGHNQAEVIARALSGVAGIDVEPVALARTGGADRRRAGADRAARAASVRGAFRGARGCIDGARVLLVDDLYTTGATADACATALLDAGAREVGVLTIGRVLGR